MQQYYNNLVQASNDYYGKPEVCDSSRYSVHIRESPRSPMGNSGSGITVKGYAGRAVNTSYDYMPASAFLGPPDHHRTLGHHGHQQDLYHTGPVAGSSQRWA